MVISPRIYDFNSPPEVEVTSVPNLLTRGETLFRDKRHRCYILLAGEGNVVLQRGEIAFVAPCLIWLPPGAATRIVLEAGCRGELLSVTEVGLAQSVPTGPISSQIRAILMDPLIKTRIDLKHIKKLSHTLENITDEIDGEDSGAQESIQHLLSLFFISVWRMSGPVQREAQPLPRTIALQFLQLVELHLCDHWTVARYAQEIGVTPDRLNSTLRRTTGRPPLTLIHARIIHEADALLDDSSLQISEIAEELGFTDPAYFSRFYKRICGHSPNYQRRNLHSTKNHLSYAAWP